MTLLSQVKLSYLIGCSLFTILVNFCEGKSYDTLKKATLIITPRIYSKGYLPYTGSLVNNHLTSDINIYYEHRVVGFFIIKSHDLEVPRSPLNYLQPGLFGTIGINSYLRARVYLGYQFSQAHGFRDASSDYFGATGLYWDIVSGISLEIISLLYDLEHELKIANRLLLAWQSNLFKVDLYLWNRAELETHNNATSAMLAITVPNFKISNSITLAITSSYQGYLSRSKPGYAKRSGFLFSLAVPIKCKSK